MEKLYNKIIIHIINQLRGQKFNLSKDDIIQELNIPIDIFDRISSIYFLPNFLIDLSKNPDAQEVFKKISKEIDKLDENIKFSELQVTRERIREIEAKALKKLKKPDHNPPDDVA